MVSVFPTFIVFTFVCFFAVSGLSGAIVTTDLTMTSSASATGTLVNDGPFTGLSSTAVTLTATGSAPGSEIIGSTFAMNADVWEFREQRDGFMTIDFGISNTDGGVADLTLTFVNVSRRSRIGNFLLTFADGTVVSNAAFSIDPVVPFPANTPSGNLLVTETVGGNTFLTSAAGGNGGQSSATISFGSIASTSPSGYDNFANGPLHSVTFELDARNATAGLGAGLQVTGTLVPGTPVPEPSSILLLGLGALQLMRRRR